MTAVGLFHFFWAWNDFFAPLIYLQGSPNLYTISIGMTQFANIFNSQPGYAMAAAMMAIALSVVVSSSRSVPSCRALSSPASRNRT